MLKNELKHEKPNNHFFSLVFVYVDILRGQRNVRYYERILSDKKKSYNCT